MLRQLAGNRVTTDVPCTRAQIHFYNKPTTRPVRNWIVTSKLSFQNPDFKKSIAISGEFIRQHSKKRQDKGTSAALDLGACDTGSSFRVENRPSNVRWRKPQRWRVGMEYSCPMVLRYRISPANRWRCSTLG